MDKRELAEKYAGDREYPLDDVAYNAFLAGYDFGYADGQDSASRSHMENRRILEEAQKALTVARAKGLVEFVRNLSKLQTSEEYEEIHGEEPDDSDFAINCDIAIIKARDALADWEAGK